MKMMRTSTDTKTEVAQLLAHSSPQFWNTHKPDKHNQKPAYRSKLAMLAFPYNKHLDKWKWKSQNSFCYVHKGFWKKRPHHLESENNGSI